MLCFDLLGAEASGTSTTNMIIPWVALAYSAWRLMGSERLGVLGLGLPVHRAEMT